MSVNRFAKRQPPVVEHLNDGAHSDGDEKGHDEDRGLLFEGSAQLSEGGGTPGWRPIEQAP